MPDSMAPSESELNTRLKKLYPAVKEDLTPLPRKWSSRDKFGYISLSSDHLKVLYKGKGKTHRDAASVRATYPIPSSCGIFYFEITIISKGRDGYMGIGLSAQGVNLNRLPGWEKLSYGYHGDDGHSFYATGTGQQYGPTFTTGDVIGCCFNMIDKSCFYTKNGVNIGIAFRDLPSLPLFPTVGLQTPNEELSANFGQHAFVFDFEDYLKEWKASSRVTIDNYCIHDEYGQFRTILQKLVSSYLIHHGYVASTEAFNNSINQGLDHYEDITSIKNRQKIQKLALMGKIGEAIDTTDLHFPGILSRNPDLLFLLKVRQFIEMVNGTESEVRNLTRKPSSSSNYNSPAMSPKHPSWHKSASNSPASSHNGFSPHPQQFRSPEQKIFPSASVGDSHSLAEPMNVENTKKCSSASTSGSDMETDSEDDQNGKGEPSNGIVSNGFSKEDDSKEATYSSHKQLCGGDQLAIERMMLFGQQLLKLSKEIKSEEAKSKNKKTLQDAFSLLAYTDPWNSPVGYQLDPIQREPVCAALNSKILESQNLPKRPPVLSVVGQTQQCLQKMLSAQLGSAAFVCLSDYLQ